MLQLSSSGSSSGGVSTSTTKMNPRRRHCGLKISPLVRNNRLSHKVIIGHRGAPFHLPEHTIASYRLALELGVDYIEPDLVSTKDGRLVASHSLDLNDTTNVADVFPISRSDTKERNNNRTGYWISDFTLKEIKTLRVRQRYGYGKNGDTNFRTTLYDDVFTIPTLEEIINLLYNWNTNLLPQYESRPHTEIQQQPIITRRAGLYAELKDPKWFLDENLNLVDLFLKELTQYANANGNGSNDDTILHDTQCPLIEVDEYYLVPQLVVQCFDGDVLQELYDKWSKHNFFNDKNTTTELLSPPPPPPMVILVDKEECDTKNNKDERNLWFNIEHKWDTFLHGIGPSKSCLEPLETAKIFQEKAHKHNLAVHVWTTRPEYNNVDEYFQNQIEELEYFLCHVGADGIFTEDVSTAKTIVQRPNCQLNQFNNKYTSTAETPTSAPSDNNNNNDCSNKNKNSALNEESIYLALAMGIMGLFIGVLSTVTITTSRYCKSRRHTRRQLRIPTQDDIEMT
eukprot:CAMPEP_0194159804 /NCGR_PEP_ID=MMETSP0152-20130528/78039_1 /TAXON_ID=1049557 /ORGANISM="Thalassiothrix antarctica, Strain L6-D1" /LENGTH=510 /DNA_ID=CAMNT_0038869421 /DNA_START=257 /DNA_END=1785 /DNA_ORIENTATION=-